MLLAVSDAFQRIESQVWYYQFTKGKVTQWSVDLIKVKVKAFPYSIPSIGPGLESRCTGSQPAVGYHYFPLGLRLPSQLQSITALWPVPSSTAW